MKRWISIAWFVGGVWILLLMPMLTVFATERVFTCDLNQQSAECRDYLKVMRGRTLGHKIPALGAQIQTASCNLTEQYGQCREYTVLMGAIETIGALREGCASMSGVFSDRRCPDSAAAICQDIVRNYHHPDVVYDNWYYLDYNVGLDEADISVVCTNLGGELRRP